mgnify:CR=1 FL=1
MSEELPDYIGHRQRLKERFKLGGGGDMADYEMLELLLTLAIPRKDTKPLAKALVKEFGSFAEVLFASDDKLMTFTGLKENTILVFRIVREAALRMTWQKLSATEAPVLTSYDAIIEYCRAASGYKDREEFRVIFLNAKNRIIGEEVQQRGSVNAVAIHPGEVMRSAVLKGATALILVHNHPSGETTPSQADKTLTQRLVQVLQLVDIRVPDHLIVGGRQIYSFAEHGLL